jgi:hypothetical protein
MDTKHYPAEFKGSDQKWLQDASMEMKKINSGKLRAIGYDARARLLRVQLDDGSMLK